MSELWEEYEERQKDKAMAKWHKAKYLLYIPLIAILGYFAYILYWPINAMHITYFICAVLAILVHKFLWKKNWKEEPLEYTYFLCFFFGPFALLYMIQAAIIWHQMKRP
jgi:predicted PurR-regulated permease PerM